MRVGYLFNHANIVGGGEISFIDLADAVRRFGVEPVAIVPGPGEVAERVGALGVEEAVSPWPHLDVPGLAAFPFRTRKISRLFGELRLDLVHANGARCMLYAGPAAKSAGIPCVWHARVLERDRLLDRIRARHATAIVANSRAVAESVGRFAGRGKRIEVIYNGIRLEEMKNAPAADLQRELGIPAGPVVLGVGRFTPRKRFEDVIRACSILDGRGTKLSLALVGAALPDEETYELRLRKTAAAAGLRRVVFAGWRNDVASLMKSASVLVVPSSEEGFGRVIVEAWACGLPVVAGNEGGPAEIIRDGVDGLLVKTMAPELISDAIERILTDRPLAGRLSSAGLQRARDFSLSEHAGKIASLYEDLMASRKRDRS